MKTIDVNGVGVLTEEQILNLYNNAKKFKIENKVLRQEISAIKEESL